MSLCPCLLAQMKSAPTFTQRSLVKVYRGVVKKTSCDLIDINIQYIKFSVQFSICVCWLLPGFFPKDVSFPWKTVRMNGVKKTWCSVTELILWAPHQRVGAQGGCALLWWAEMANDEAALLLCICMATSSLQHIFTEVLRHNLCTLKFTLLSVQFSGF